MRNLLKILPYSSKAKLMQHFSKAKMFSAELGVYSSISFAGIHFPSLTYKCNCLIIVKTIPGTGNNESSFTHHAQLLTALIL